MSAPMVFAFDSIALRVQMDEAGNPWFSATDVCQALDLENPYQAVKSHVDADDLQKLEVIDSLGRTQAANHVNESGMYALIFGSTKEAAKRFKRWVTHEVLPSLRKTGSYTMRCLSSPLETREPRVATVAIASACAACYNPPVTSKKGVIGIGLPSHPCSASRRIRAVSAALLSVPLFMVARMGSRKARRFPQGVYGSPTCPSCRHGLDSEAVVFENYTPWRPIMAKRTHGAAAPVSPLHQAHSAMQDVHILAMSELVNIQTVARLAALALANPSAGKQIPTIVAAFEHIQSIANGLQNDIDVCAERIGCAVAFVDQPNSSGVPA